MRSVYIFGIVFSLLFFSTASANTGTLITREKVFLELENIFGATVPESFQYIRLQYRDVKTESPLQNALQKLVYLNIIPNSQSFIYPEKNLTLGEFEILLNSLGGLQINSGIEGKNTIPLESPVFYTLLEKYSSELSKQTTAENSENSFQFLGEKQKIFEDVYETLISEHYDRDTLSTEKMVDGAIKGLTESVGDKYTTYFPPTESKNFQEHLEGEFEGIGAYVDMTQPGVLIIVSPIVGSPAEKAGLKGGDQIISVNGKKIEETTSSQEAISWIKGAKNTEVELEIKREGEKNNIFIKVIRDTIILKDVEYKLLQKGIYYIQIKNFGEKVDDEFEDALNAIKSEKGIKKIIIDLRNNPGGYLDEVSQVLSFFLDKGVTTAIVSEGENDLSYVSRGYEKFPLENYEVILLQNSGTASASEIMIGTLHDYFPDITILGEKSFGKGSVQSLKKYFDGSMLKYTSARWYTGKNRIGIDKIGITPEISVEFNTEEWQKNARDTQLEAAIKQ